MNVIDLERFDKLKRDYYHAMGGYLECPYIECGRLLRRDHGHRLMKLAVIHVCRAIVEEGLCEISTNALSKRIGRRYHRLRRAKGIPEHTRPKLTVGCMGKLIAFIRGIPQDVRYTDALESVFVHCIEYWESKRERWVRLHSPTGLVNPCGGYRGFTPGRW